MYGGAFSMGSPGTVSVGSLGQNMPTPPTTTPPASNGTLNWLSRARSFSRMRLDTSRTPSAGSAPPSLVNPTALRGFSPDSTYLLNETLTSRSSPGASVPPVRITELLVTSWLHPGGACMIMNDSPISSSNIHSTVCTVVSTPSKLYPRYPLYSMGPIISPMVSETSPAAPASSNAIATTCRGFKTITDDSDNLGVITI